MSDIVLKDPITAQHDIIDKVKDKLLGVEVVEATTPYGLLIESMTALAADGITHIYNQSQELYPALARTFEDISRHLSDNELNTLFHTPSTAVFSFYLSKQDIINYGEPILLASGSTAYKVSIPKNTFITINDVNFTLFENVDVMADSNNLTLVEVQSDITSIALQGLGNIDSIIVTDGDGVDWIVFKLPIKQVDYSLYRENLDTLITFDKKYNLPNEFYKTKMSLTTTVNNAPVVTNVDLTLNKADLHENITAVLSIGEKSLNVSIPDVYNKLGGKAGELDIAIYSTLGDIYMPLYKFDRTEFSVTLGDTKTTSEIASNNVTISVFSTDVTTGGSNGKPIADIIQGVINRSNGETLVPITEYELEESARVSGFKIKKELDVITNRTYSAYKFLPHEPFLDIPSIPTPLLGNIVTSDNDVAGTTKVKRSVLNDKLIIQADTMFKSSGFKLELMTDVEIATLNALAQEEKVKYIQNNKVVYTPYTYVISKNNSTVGLDIYSTEKPELTSLKIVSKNDIVPIRVNINGYNIKRTQTGYSVQFNTIQLAETPITDIKCVLVFNVNNTPIHFIGTPTVVDATNKIFTFNIDTDLVIDDNNVNITNGVSTLTKTDITVSGTMDVYLYTSNVLVHTPGNVTSVDNELSTILGTTTNAVLTKQRTDYTLAVKLDTLWSSIYSTFSNKTYKRYTTDIPALYESDVFVKVNNCAYTKVGDVVTKNISHSKNDPILDANNNPVMKYSAGDIIRDANGDPILDIDSFEQYHIDVLVLEYGYKANQHADYKQAVTDTDNLLYSWITKDVKSIYNQLLENTKLMFKPGYNLDNVNILMNGRNRQFPRFTKPTVNLVVTSDVFLNNNPISNLKNTIGKILTTHFTMDTINLNDIRDDIIKSLGSLVIGVQVKGIGTDDEVMKYNVDSNKFMLDKTITIDGSISYDLDIKITTTI